MIRKIAAALAALALSLPLASAAETADDGLTFGVYMGGGGGSALSLAIGAPDFTSITDLTPVSQFTNGWTAALTIPTLTPAGTTSAYNLGWTPASPASKLTLTVSSPGYTSTGGATSVTRTVYGTSWLRQTYNNATLPTESATGGVRADLTLSDYIYQADTVTGSSVGAGLYTNGSASPSGSPSVSSAASNGYPTYPVPVCAWASPPGQRFDATTSLTVEIYCTGASGNGNGSLASVGITATDGTNSVTHTTSSLTLSALHTVSNCTGTNGSNVLTSCDNTAGWIVGERGTVPGIPGQPKLLSKTSTSLTFGVTNANCTTTTNSGNVSFTNAALGDGEGLADGAFIGASVSGTNITTPANASITSDTVTADVTIVSGKATAAMVHTNATVTTAGTNGSCTIAHNYQGTTGAVKAVEGVPVYDYQVTFTAADLATLTDGNVWFRAKAYPVIGNAAAVLDTQLGADGTGKDWNGVSFAVNGTDISPNLHNLWAYKDAAGAYIPVYAWVNGTGGGSPAVSTSAADPGSTAYYASVSAAVTALKAYYNANKSHNDANGGVVCLLAAGSPYLGWGAQVTTNFTANKPPPTLTSVLSAGTCSPTASASSDTTVTIGHSATAAYAYLPAFSRVNNLTLSATAASLQGNDGNLSGTMPSYSIVLNGDIGIPTASSPTVYKIGAWWVYNSLIDERSFDGSFLTFYSNNTNAPALIFGNTLVCGAFGTRVATMTSFDYLGNAAFGCNFSQPGASGVSVYYVQPTSLTLADNKIMGAMAVNGFQFDNMNRIAVVQNVFECINDSANTPCLLVSADSMNMPFANEFRFYNTVIGERSNSRYVEGAPSTTPVPISCAATGGTIPAATYYFEIAYATAANPTVITSTDGPTTAPVTTTGSTSSCTVPLFRDPNYVAYIYTGTTSTPDATWTFVTPSAAGSPTAMGTNFVGTALGATVQPPLIGSTAVAHNELKTLAFEAFNIDESYNIKGDAFNGGAAGEVPNGARVGNWAPRWHVGDIGNVWVTGTVISAGLGPLTALGEVLCPYCNYNTANLATDLSWVVYKSDRSWGGHSASLVTPALNLGEGNYCPKTSTTNAANRVPSGAARLAYDVNGNARKNDGTGWAGAYEGAFCL